MIFVYSDVLFRSGGIESYLYALSLHLRAARVPFRVVVAELERCPLLDELVSLEIPVYRQRRLPGDRWLIRQRVMMWWLRFRLAPGDWVFCVRQPMPNLYLQLVRHVHSRRAKLAASWALSPDCLQPPSGNFARAVRETDAVISVSRCTVEQFSVLYRYEGPVHVVPYHNLAFCDSPIPLAPGPPWRIGYLGRLEIRQKNLDQLITAFAIVAKERDDVELHLYGGGPDEGKLQQIAEQAGLARRAFFHGRYDHRKELPVIMAANHLFVYPSRYEGGPCFSLLEIMQAGRFCVASAVGGIPDLYQDRPDLGTLVPSGDISALAAALRSAVQKVAAGEVSEEAIRDRYEEGFNISAAHGAWLTALGLDMSRA